MGWVSEISEVMFRKVSELLAIPQSPDRTAVDGCKFQFSQPWRDTPAPEFCPGEVRLAYNEKFFIVEADLVDDAVLTTATADNQRMWELGDTFEVFLKIEECSNYIELHVTPNNQRLHLAFPNVSRRLTPDSPPLPLEKMFVEPPAFHSNVKKTDAGWRVSVEIPAGTVGLPTLEAGMQFRVSFGRYDAYPVGDPVISTTSAHSVINFHRPDEWTAVVLGK